MRYITSKNLILLDSDGTTPTVAASQTNQAVSIPIPISSYDALVMMLNYKVSAITVAAAITVTLQESWDGGTTWQSTGLTSTPTTTTTYEITQNVFSTGGPLWPLLRLVVTTGAGDTITISDIVVTKGEF